MSENLVNLLADLKDKEVLELVQQRLDAGEDPLKILEDSRKGMEIVGQRFATSEYFLPELVFSGDLLKRLTELVKPHLKQEVAPKKLGKVIIGTVAGDIHDIGLNIVDFMLDVNGFEVYNLGVDVPIEAFVNKIKETGATIVGLSGFLTPAFDVMKEAVAAIEAAGMRDKVKIMIGGGQLDDGIRKYTKADAYGKDAMVAVALAKGWIGEK
ncbi:MAG: cobalamin-dependent protein [Dehalococcoidales bacterium]|nr:cobalamin-dependent protein [Dehalococcoidales bacterium]